MSIRFIVKSGECDAENMEQQCVDVTVAWCRVTVMIASLADGRWWRRVVVRALQSTNNTLISANKWPTHVRQNRYIRHASCLLLTHYDYAHKCVRLPHQATDAGTGIVCYTAARLLCRARSAQLTQLRWWSYCKSIGHWQHNTQSSDRLKLVDGGVAEHYTIHNLEQSMTGSYAAEQNGNDVGRLYLICLHNEYPIQFSDRMHHHNMQVISSKFMCTCK